MHEVRRPAPDVGGHPQLGIGEHAEPGGALPRAADDLVGDHLDQTAVTRGSLGLRAVDAPGVGVALCDAAADLLRAGLDDMPARGQQAQVVRGIRLGDVELAGDLGRAHLDTGEQREHADADGVGDRPQRRDLQRHVGESANVRLDCQTSLWRFAENTSLDGGWAAVGRRRENEGVRAALDLNADVGEGFDSDTELFALITSANVACGFHAGDASTMRLCCELAAARGVAVGAQVSYRDRAGFGRRDVDVSVDDLAEPPSSEQVADLRDAATAAGVDIGYIKPHGALYNRIVWDAEQAAAVVSVARRHGLPLLGLPGSRALGLGADAGVATFLEFFADRGYTADGRLVPRSEPGALVADADAVAARVARMATAGVVESVDGTDVVVEADSVCVHGDTPDAVALARSARVALEGTGCIA